MVVATVLTACGIETMNLPCEGDYGAVVLQQYLPLAVLKRLKQQRSLLRTSFKLQQYLPLAVLKRKYSCFTNEEILEVATVLTACGIETVIFFLDVFQCFIAVATVLTACGIET